VSQGPNHNDGARPPERRTPRLALLAAFALLLSLSAALAVRADEPFARSRVYDLQHSTIRLAFDTHHRAISGDVTHQLSMLREGATEIQFDSVQLHIESVTLDGQSAQFDVTPAEIAVTLPSPAHRGDRHTVEIRYDGRPRRGVYFILPDKNYPDRPREIWTQGEAEDTRYYLPTYDYPNDRVTTDTYLTVPADWETVSNGKLESKTPDGKGHVVWHWVQEAPLSTYLISVVAGELDRVDSTWRSIPVTYYAPRGRADRIPITFAHTHEMLDFFSSTFGVTYPWPKYAQVTVDEFVEEGMENTSATTLTTSALMNPATAAEFPLRQDDLLAHELSHQWFGDLVTCKDWTNLWLNEGFATLMEYLWEEHKYGRDEADYTRWNAARDWLADERLYSVPILNSNFSDSLDYYGNTYGKAGLVLYILREQLGPADFYASLKHYLEKYRGKNVVTADLAAALEESSSRNVDQFFKQWIYGAGAPNLSLHFSYDEKQREVRLEVKQTQKLEGAVGLFTLPTGVEITTASGAKKFPLVISRANETFQFSVDGPPLLVLFDPGGILLSSVHFEKTQKEWMYQLRHAATVPARDEAAVALGNISQEAVISALAEAARLDPFWGVRTQAITALAKLGGSGARDALFTALEDPDARVAATAATLLGGFRDDPLVAQRLEGVFRAGRFYRQREAAVASIGRLRGPHAYDLLVEAVREESPDDVLRRAAFLGFASLGDARATRLVLDWAAPGRPLNTRAAAIRALGALEVRNPDVNKRLLSFLDERISSVRRAALGALSARGDASTIAPIEAALDRGDLAGPVEDYARRVVARLKKTKEESSAPAAPASPN